MMVVRLMGRAMVLLTLVLAVGCTSHTVKKVNAVQVTRAQEALPQEALLDVGIVIFDPGIPASVDPRDDDQIFPEVRRGEARYIPYLLRDTMEKTNQWGAVRVLPTVDPTAEVVVTGTIVESDGYVLELDVQAFDATGRKWLDKTYEDSATQFAYRDDVDYDGDPFQDIYNQITNDLIAARNHLARKDLSQIRGVAQLRYAAEIAPEAFGDHLKEERNGRVVINRLPSPNDPMLARVNRIRESEYLFVDTVDQQYGLFYQQMDDSYDQWRRFSYEETLAMIDTKRSARTRMLAGALAAVGGGLISSQSNSSAGSIVGTSALLGGLSLMKQGYDTGKQAEIHEQALRELATSFDSEVAPIVMEVEGEVVKLSGSIEAQYADRSYGPFERIPIAVDVNPELFVFLEERPDAFPGVNVVEETVRSYPYGSVAAHLLGYVGPITRDEWQVRNDEIDRQWEGQDIPLPGDPGPRPKTYQLNHEVGKTGVELIFEDELRGTPGSRWLEVDA
ncbi:MAG: hypothetical protein AAGE01_17235, partial [Pseudomonadota bacterium]